MMNAGHAPDEPVQPEQPFFIEELVPAFVVGATDAEETAVVLRHAATAQVASELGRYAPMAEALLYAGPAVPPPVGLATSLRAALAAPPAAAVAPALPNATTAAEPAPFSPVAQAFAPPPAVATSGSGLGQGARAWQWPQLAAAAAAILLLFLNLYWLREISALRQNYVALQGQMRQQADAFMLRMLEQENLLAAQQQQILRQDELVGTLMADAGERYTMQPVEPDSAAVAQVAWLEGSNVAVLRAQNFPILEEDKQYQLWLISGDERTSGGVFTVDDYGCANILFHPEQSLEAFDGMGITPEPAGGSPGPTAPPIVRAEL
jgi:anti-sigma-K factor RskA